MDRLADIKLRESRLEAREKELDICMVQLEFHQRQSQKLINNWRRKKVNEMLDETNPPVLPGKPGPRTVKIERFIKSLEETGLNNEQLEGFETPRSCNASTVTRASPCMLRDPYLSECSSGEEEPVHF